MPRMPLSESEPTAVPDGSGLRLFLDSAEPADWKQWLPLGLFHGVTTNPVLLHRAGQECSLANLANITTCVRDLGAREIQLQTWGASSDEMFERAGRLALLAGPGIEVTIKVPCTFEGLGVARQLAAAGTRVTLTAVFNPGQVVIAASLGATYAAPYLGRLVDAGAPGPDLILAMNDILRSTATPTRLLVASLRGAAQVIALARRGLDTFTFGPAVAAELLQDELTDEAVAQFQAAAAAMGGAD